VISQGKKYRYNDKYHIIVKDNSIHIIYTDSGKEIKQYTNKCGYNTVYLYPATHFSRQASPVAVHSIVAHCVLGSKPKGLEINHIDGIKTNNHPSNLEYVPHKKNMEHASKTGLLNSTKNKQIKKDNKKAIDQHYKDLAYIKHMLNKLGK
jgi:hypothetical protein